MIGDGVRILGSVSTASASTRTSPVAAAIRAARLIVVLRRIAPRARLIDTVRELHAAGARVFEVTFDAPEAGEDLAAVSETLPGRDATSRAWVGAGTVRTSRQLGAARVAGAAFAVSPVFDPVIVAAALDVDLPFIPGAYTPTEIDAAWRAGATLVKVFPASSLGPSHLREIRGPLPEVELIPTGGVDGTNALDFLAAGAVAVGIGSALVRSSASERRGLIEMIAGAPRS